MLAQVQLGAHQDPLVLFQTVGPQHILVPETVPLQGQVSAFPLVELWEIPLCSLLQPAEIPLNANTTIWFISHSS